MTGLERLPALHLLVEVRCGQTMAQCVRARELVSESQALCAEAAMIYGRAPRIRQEARRQLEIPRAPTPVASR
jgi:hypothetical protein